MRTRARGQMIDGVDVDDGRERAVCCGGGAG